MRAAPPADGSRLDSACHAALPPAAAATAVETLWLFSTPPHPPCCPPAAPAASAAARREGGRRWSCCCCRRTPAQPCLPPSFPPCPARSCSPGRSAPPARPRCAGTCWRCGGWARRQGVPVGGMQGVVHATGGMRQGACGRRPHLAALILKRLLARLKGARARPMMLRRGPTRLCSPLAWLPGDSDPSAPSPSDGAPATTCTSSTPPCAACAPPPLSSSSSTIGGCAPINRWRELRRGGALA